MSEAAERPGADVSYDLDLLRSRSLTSVLQLEIEKIILGGELAPGERLNENALATRFKVSRGPVREACRALAAKGLVKLIPNRGVFIRKITKFEAAEIYDVRAALFGTACRLLAVRVTTEQVADFEALLKGMDEAAMERDIDAYYPLNLAFHALIVDSAGNATLAKAYRDQVERLHLFRARGIVHGGGFAVSNREHRAIFDALIAGDAVTAFEAGYAHVQTAKDRILATGDRPAGAAN